eukprot:TRINITY_DN48808_c0_g1_i1.p1 TRINITY_DN48808_c0_g1~~TRINITY_DN48808_c0_g1_i1.p1  ORF type:complete len:275 (+),score=11.15 TRINITY_DN48808_c0_g1_i1:47-871(+)
MSAWKTHVPAQLTVLPPGSAPSSEFTTWLRAQGINEISMKQLFAHDVLDFRTFTRLRDSDFHDLGLSLGQLRLLQHSAQSLTTTDPQRMPLMSSQGATSPHRTIPEVARLNDAFDSYASGSSSPSSPTSPTSAGSLFSPKSQTSSRAQSPIRRLGKDPNYIHYKPVPGLGVDHSDVWHLATSMEDSTPSRCDMAGCVATAVNICSECDKVLCPYHSRIRVGNFSFCCPRSGAVYHCDECHRDSMCQACVCQICAVTGMLTLVPAIWLVATFALK